tara:strand:+ start:15494 stop:15892 length:399 start_codon:yes stop_codon:yes gene_type:complete
MSDVLKEYESADFGFSAIDEETYKAKQTSSEATPSSVDENDVQRVVLNSIKPLEDKLDSLLKRKSIEDDGTIAEAALQAREEVLGKLRQLEELVMPLYANLLKTSDKEYIHWPNRKERLEAEMKKILAITRG